MRNYLLSIIILLSASASLYSSNWQQRADSLRVLLIDTKEDTTRINLLLDLGDELISNEPHNALLYFEQAKEIADKLGDTTLMVSCILGVCDVNSMMSEYSTAIELTYKALELAENNNYLLSLCHNRLAGLYYYMEDFEQSVAQNRISLKYNQLDNDTSGMAVDLHNIASYYLEVDKLDSAVYYFHQSMRYDRLSGNKTSSYNHSNLGHTFTYMGEYDSALYYQFMAYEMDSANELTYELSVDEYYIAFTHFKKGDYKTAIYYLEKSLARAKQLDLLELLIFNYELGYEIHEKMENYKQALEYAVLRNNFSDSLRDKNKQSTIQSIETKHKFEQQQKVLATTEAKNALLEKHKNLLIAFSFVTLLLLISTGFIIKQKQKQNKANKKLLEALEKANLSKEKMISVISHDLRGSIGNLKNAIEVIMDESLDFDTMKGLIYSFFPVVDSTYDLLENLLTWARYSREDLEPQIEEINMLHIAQQSIKHTEHLAESKQIEIINQVEDALINADKNMMLMVVRNLISNAVKFSNEKSKVIIRSATTKSMAEIEVIDEGVGIPEKILKSIFNNIDHYHSKGTNGERGSGLGLALCHSFIKKHKGDINVDSVPGEGSTFRFTIPTSTVKYG